MNKRRQHREYSFGSSCFQPDPRHAQNISMNKKVTLNGESAKGLSTSGGRTSFEPVNAKGGNYSGLR